MDETVYWYSLATVLLFFKMFATSAYQGFHRIGKNTFKTPEDAAFVGQEPAQEELPQVQRAAKACSTWPVCSRGGPSPMRSALCACSS